MEKLRKLHRPVSSERINSGLGIVQIYQILTELEKRPATLHNGREVWTAALEGPESLAVAAMVFA